MSSIMSMNAVATSIALCSVIRASSHELLIDFLEANSTLAEILLLLTLPALPAELNSRIAS